ncbi:MAG TPA: DUF4169 family protein [Ferrovibrio sp.]|uniref:DUF4169 family protein n=1 Tax=Ferrovibrio sp. TaxID=1917215 RepID=UPI002ED51096
MGDVVNLNKARKERERRAAKAQAAANRVRHGQSKAGKAFERREADRAAKDLDGKKLD